MQNLVDLLPLFADIIVPFGVTYEKNWNDTEKGSSARHDFNTEFRSGFLIWEFPFLDLNFDSALAWHGPCNFYTKFPEMGTHKPIAGFWPHNLRSTVIHYMEIRMAPAQG